MCGTGWPRDLIENLAQRHQVHCATHRCCGILPLGRGRLRRLPPGILLLGLLDLTLQAGNLPLEALVVVVVGQVAQLLGAVLEYPLAAAGGPVRLALAVDAVGEVDAVCVDAGGEEAGAGLVDAEARAGDGLGVVLDVVEFIVGLGAGCCGLGGLDIILSQRGGVG